MTKSEAIIDMSRCAIRGDYYPVWEMVKVWINTHDYVTVHTEFRAGVTAASKAGRVKEYIVHSRRAYEV